MADDVSVRAAGTALALRLRGWAIPCPGCRGAGEVLPVTTAGPALAAFRADHGVTTRAVAERLGWYLGDVHWLEQGRGAAVPPATADAYVAAVATGDAAA